MDVERIGKRFWTRILTCTALAWVLVLSPHLVWAQRPAVVDVAMVKQETIAQPVIFVGTVEPRRRSQVASEVAGVVAKLYVEEGQPVRQGDPLIDLRRERLKIALRATQSTAERYRQELAALKNGTRPEEIAEAQAGLEEAEAELEQARREKRRQLDLSKRGVTSLQSREDADTAFNVAQKRLTRARKRHELAALGPRAERIAQGQAEYQAAKAEVARMQYDINRSQVRAPFDGFVVTKDTEIGQWLDVGDPVMTLIELDPARVSVALPERFIAQVRLGMAASVQLDAFPGRQWQGMITQVIPQATESRTFPVVVDVPNPEAQIKSGSFARVVLTIGELQAALLVPKDAIVTQGPRQIVYAIRDGKAAPVPVQRSTFYQGFAVVAGALKAGEQVVVRGNERLRPGQPVRVAKTASEG